MIGKFQKAHVKILQTENTKNIKLNIPTMCNYIYFVYDYIRCQSKDVKQYISHVIKYMLILLKLHKMSIRNIRYDNMLYSDT